MAVSRDRGGAGHGSVATAELPALTALRGIAALTVVFYHASFLAHNHAGGAPPVLWQRGYLAVDLFFLLSGFVLTHVYGGRLAGARHWRTVGGFLWARFCRLYPASLFTVAVYVVLYALGRLDSPAGFSFETQLTASLLLMQVPWLHNIWVNGPSWSISAELYAYLLFPFVVPVMLRLKRPAAMALGIALLIGVTADHMIFSHEQQDWGWGALLRALPEFAIGVLAYRAYSEGLFRTFWEKDTTLLVVTAAIISASFAGVSDGLTVLLLLALLLAAVSNSGRLAGLLNARPLRWLGDVSYSVYIFQSVPLMVMVGHSKTLVALGLGGVRFEVIGVLLALGSGVLVHRRVDLPARAALRRLPARLAAVAAARRNSRSSAVFAEVESHCLPVMAGLVAGQPKKSPTGSPGQARE
jgi:peptidoglycan/LPS O-acetylase OafA/YrhL